MKLLKRTQGFTLIELSIVLVILSLVVGAIVGGRSLIHSAELRSVIVDFNNYNIAVNAFVLEFDSLPGDFPEAYDYFGSECGADSLAPAGCNGNGQAGVELDEAYRAWQHLFLADIIGGYYPGVQGDALVGINMPEGPMDGSGYLIWNLEQDYKNFIQFGHEVTGGDGPMMGVMHARDAHAIDKKVDDGEAKSGVLVTQNGYTGAWVEQLGCMDKSETPYVYDLTSSETTCLLSYRIGR